MSFAITNQSYTEDQIFNLGWGDVNVPYTNIYTINNYLEHSSEIYNNQLLIININLNKLDSINPSSIQMGNSSVCDFLGYQNLKSIKIANCLSNQTLNIPQACADIEILNSKYANINLSNTNLDRLIVENTQTPIVIESSKYLKLHECNVSCKNCGEIISYSNNGAIENIIINDLDNINVCCDNCKSINIKNCRNIFMGSYDPYWAYTYASESISITNSTFKSLYVDFSSGNVDLNGSEWIEISNPDTEFCQFGIKNFEGESIYGFPINVCDDAILWNCPNFIVDSNYKWALSLINSNTSILPECWGLIIIACSSLESYDGKCTHLSIFCCDNIETVDISNVENSYIIGNRNLKSFTYNNITYGTNIPVDEFLKLPDNLYRIFRCNGFDNVDFRSNPNFINNSLVYNNSYKLNIYNESQLIKSMFDDSDQTKNIINTGIGDIKYNISTNDNTYNIIDSFGIYINSPSIRFNNIPLRPCIIEKLSNETIESINNIVDKSRYIYPLMIISSSELNTSENLIFLKIESINVIESKNFYINLIIKEQ